MVEDLTLSTLHSVVLEGLTSSTTYHFQVLSADALNNLASTADDTFETGPDSGLVSDDFNHCAGLLAPWSYIDPFGDGSSHGVTGVGTDDAWLHLSVPAGLDHDPYGAGLLPPRVSQPVFDVDFEFEVKFTSDLTSTIQQQGVLIEQDLDDWIRFDVYRSGSQNRAFVGSTVGGSTSTEAHATVALVAPMHLRVTRVGDDWTCWWSSDGASWNSLVTFTRVMVATQVSLYGGNAGGAGRAGPDGPGRLVPGHGQADPDRGRQLPRQRPVHPDREHDRKRQHPALPGPAGLPVHRRGGP